MRLSEGFYLSSFISGGAIGIIASIIWIINVFTEIDDILFIISLGTGIIPSIYGITIFCVFWYKVWVSIQDGHARTTPGKAIGFMFIPFFNGYWLFQSIWGFAKDYNTTFNDTDLITLNYQMACFLRIVSWVVAPYYQQWVWQ